MNLGEKGGLKISSYKVMVYIVMIILTLQFALGEVVVFSNYETTTTLRDDRLHIEREITLQNVGSNPIIPGELHFRIHELKEGKHVASQIRNLEVYNDYGQEMNNRKVEGDDETQLVVSLWEPVLPQFSYKIYMTYDIMFETKGILFYELVVPVEETTIPIRNSENMIHIPSRYHVTNAPDAQVRMIEKEGNEYSEVNWEGKKQMPVEYSVLPLPRLGIKAVNLFWGVIIIITLILSYVLHRKLR